MPNNTKNTINKMCELARIRNGECLSTNYINRNKKLTWKCDKGHIWDTTPANIIVGSWCPYCAKKVTENICRYFFEELFESQFPTIRPDWLKSEKGTQLELDGYNKKLNVAFEYNGRQHYQDIPWYKNDFREIQKIDALKEQICKKKGILLITIPFTIKIKDMQRFIITELQKNQIEPAGKNKKIIWQNCTGKYDIKLQQLKDIAKTKKGECLSKYYHGTRIKLLFVCQYGHKWSALPSNIKRGTWCRVCENKRRSTNRKFTLEQIKDIAEENGVTCISKEYFSSRKALEWKCQKGHIWKSSLKTVREYGWCPICKKNKWNRKTVYSHINQLDK